MLSRKHIRSPRAVKPAFLTQTEQGNSLSCNTAEASSRNALAGGKALPSQHEHTNISPQSPVCSGAAAGTCLLKLNSFSRAANVYEQLARRQSRLTHISPALKFHSAVLLLGPFFSLTARSAYADTLLQPTYGQADFHTHVFLA